MNPYDCHVHFEDLKKTVGMARKLGWSGLVLVTNWTNEKDLEKFKKSIKKPKGFDLAIGVEIKDKPNRIKELARKLRKKAELILVHGGDLEVNRAAVETPEVDILLHPEFERQDSGLDHVMVKLAKKNNVAIEFGFSDILHSYKKTRSSVIQKLTKNARLVKKYKAPFVLTSGAFSEWGLRSPSELISFGRVLGLKDPEIKGAMSNNIIKENRKRLSGKWIMPGVEVEK